MWLGTIRARALSGETPASQFAELPAMRKYPAGTGAIIPTVEDWFNFLDAGLTALEDVDSTAASTHSALLDGIQGVLAQSSLSQADATDYLSADHPIFGVGRLNSATTAVLDNYFGIRGFLESSQQDITDPNGYVMRIEQNMERLWFNEVFNASNDAKVNNQIMAPNLMDWYPAVKEIL